jgi:hypothetical protein
MNKRLNFRVWSFLDKNFHYFQIVEGGSDYLSGIAGGVSEPQQCTDQRDCNDMYIYEGDIIKGMMDFGPGGFHEMTLPVHFHNLYGYQWEHWDMSTVKIVGNIFERKNQICDMEFPKDVIDAAIKVSNYFKERNIKEWSLMDISNRKI